MITEERVNQMFENAIEYYLKAVQEEIDLTRKEYLKLDLVNKKFNYAVEFAESIGYDYTNDFKVH